MELWKEEYIYIYSHPGVVFVNTGKSKDNRKLAMFLDWFIFIHFLSTSGWLYVCVYIYTHNWGRPLGRWNHLKP